MFIHFHMESICSSCSAKHFGILSAFDLTSDKSKCLGIRMNYFPTAPKLIAPFLFGIKVPRRRIWRKLHSGNNSVVYLLCPTRSLEVLNWLSKDPIWLKSSQSKPPVCSPRWTSNQIIALPGSEISFPAAPQLSALSGLGIHHALWRLL